MGVTAAEAVQQATDALELKQTRGAAKRLKGKLEQSRDENAKLQSERDELQRKLDEAKGQAGDADKVVDLTKQLEESQAKTTELEQSLLKSRQRATFTEAVSKLGPADGAADDLYALVETKLDELDWTGESPAEAVDAMLAEVKESKPYFFTEAEGGTEQTPEPTKPAPGGKQSTGEKSPVTYTRAQVKEFMETPFDQRDKDWKVRKADIAKAAEEGRVTD